MPRPKEIRLPGFGACSSWPSAVQPLHRRGQVGLLHAKNIMAFSSAHRPRNPMATCPTAEASLAPGMLTHSGKP
eukprot:349850-Chlamydomonas_euryale.AAC.16